MLRPSGRGLIDVTVFTFSTVTTVLSTCIQRLPSFVLHSVHSILSLYGTS